MEVLAAGMLTSDSLNFAVLLELLPAMGFVKAFFAKLQNISSQLPVRANALDISTTVNFPKLFIIQIPVHASALHMPPVDQAGFIVNPFVIALVMSSVQKVNSWMIKPANAFVRTGKQTLVMVNVEIY